MAVYFINFFECINIYMKIQVYIYTYVHYIIEYNGIFLTFLVLSQFQLRFISTVTINYMSVSQLTH